MKALLLVGGFGTRLRPLTFEKPKPLVEFANKPILEHQMEALMKIGVTDIVLGVGFKSEVMKAYTEEASKRLGINIVLSLENEPLGTAGPIRLAQDIILQNNEKGLFFVMNSDVICDFPLAEMIEFQAKTGAEGVILTTPVQDPSKYGVVVGDETGLIDKFVEKPQTYVGNLINAGIYLLKTDVIKRIPMKPTSIEREIFPAIASEKKLYNMQLKGFWMDIGQPKDFLTGLNLYLGFLKTQQSSLLATGPGIQGNVIIHPEAKVSPDALVGPNVNVGRNCVVEAGVRLQNTCLMEGCHIKANTWISDSVIGWRSVIGKWVRIEGTTVVANDCVLGNEIFINQAMILPNKEIKTSVHQAGQILM
jgi:mannose-1-phosphate guanylyltransferase